jgi:hypothetical protein
VEPRPAEAELGELMVRRDRGHQLTKEHLDVPQELIPFRDVQLSPLGLAMASIRGSGSDV